MFKVELEFDTSLSAETVNKYCNETDRIFIKDGVTIAEKSFGKRTYIDETDNGFADIGAALITMSDNDELYRAVKTAYWYKDSKCENLMETFFYEGKK